MKKWFMVACCCFFAGCASQAPKAAPVAAPVPKTVTSTPTPETVKENAIVKIKIETTLGDIYAENMKLWNQNTRSSGNCYLHDGNIDNIDITGILKGYA